MATVDLDENCECRHRARGIVREFVRDLEDPNLGVLIRHYCADELKSLMDAIERAEKAAPVAPDPGLREEIAKRIKAVEHSELVDLGYVEAITNAVLAVLAERGVR